MVNKYKLHIPIYNEYIYVYIGNTSLEAAKKIEEEYDVKLDDIEFFEAGVDTMIKEDDLNITLFFNTKTSVVSLAHESVHLAWDITGNRGIKYEQENHEGLAYLVGFILEELIDIQKKDKDGRRKTKDNKK